MKKYGVATAAVVAGLLMAQSASAVNIWRYTQYDGGGGGGEFTVFETGHEVYFDASATHFDAGRGGLGFQTFCLEKSEGWSASPAGYTVEHYAIEGGGGAFEVVPGVIGDPLSIGTAWLYRQFSDGMLSGYDYPGTGVGRTVSARALQDAIWWLEEEMTSITAGAQTVLNVALGSAELINLYGVSAYADLRANAAPNAFGVAAMNFYIYDANQELVHKQSMLTRVPDGGMTLALLGIGIVGCAFLRKRIV